MALDVGFYFSYLWYLRQASSTQGSPADEDTEVCLKNIQAACYVLGRLIKHAANEDVNTGETQKGESSVCVTYKSRL